MLLSSKNIQHFLKAFFGINVSFCLLILALALVLFPFTLLKSPEDFWWEINNEVNVLIIRWAAVVSACTTTFAVILICIGAILDSPVCAPNSVGQPPNFHVTNYFLALGTILFAYGGHPGDPVNFYIIFNLFQNKGFPTIQHDMRNPEEFTKASVVAFIRE